MSEAIFERLAKATPAVQKAVGARIAVEARIKAAAEECIRLEGSEADVRGAYDILRALAAVARKRVVGRVEEIATDALRAIFGRPELEFRIRMEESRGVTSAWFEVKHVIRGREVWCDVMDGRGGGIRDVVALVMQAMVVALTPGLRRYMSLDEPCSQVSNGYLPAVAELLLQLRRRLDMDIEMVTHEDELASACDRVYRAKLVDGATVLEIDPTRA